MPADPGGVDSPVRCSRLYGDVHDIRVLGQAWLRAVHRDRSGLRQAEGAQRRRADPPCRVPGRCSEDKRCSGRPFAGEEQKYPSACWIRMLPPRRKAPGAGGSSCSSLKRPCRSVFRCRFTDRNHLLLEMLDRAPRNEITCERRIKLSQERIRLLKRLVPSSANAISIPAIPATWTM